MITLEEFEAKLADMEERIYELERMFDDVQIDEMDTLESAHLQFAGVVRARREGSA